MRNPITDFLFITTGSFAIWATKGFKGKFNDSMISISEQHSSKGTIRFFLGVGVWILIISLAAVILSRPSKQEAYYYRINKDGKPEFENVR